MGAEAVAVGGMLSGGAQIYGNAKEARALRANAKAIELERKASAEVYDRKLYLLRKDQTKYLGSLESSFARAGIDFSGSALDVHAETTREMAIEQSALNAEARQTDLRLLNQANQMRDRAKDLTSPMTMGLTLLGTGLESSASYYKARGAS